MQIPAIRNDNSKPQNIPLKGSVGYDIRNNLIQRSKNYANCLKDLNVEKYPTIKLLWESQKKLADSTLKNLETLMSRFGKSCTLHWYPVFDKSLAELQEKVPAPAQADVFIESADSKYKHYCGKISTNLYDIHKFSMETLANTDSALVNNNFKLWATSPQADSFEAEKVISNLNDILIDERTDKAVGQEVLEKLYKESKEYEKEFGLNK